MDLALNNLQRLKCHKTKPNQILLYMPHDLHFLFTKNLMTDLSSSLEHSVRFAAILNSLKTNIL